MPNKTVFLLGAGASAASKFKLPTMGSFFTNPSGDEALEEFLREFYGKVPRCNWNLEEVLSHLDASAVHSGNERLRAATPTQLPLFEIRRRAQLYVARQLETPIGGETCTLHQKLFARTPASENDAIVTLNYDRIVDDVLAAHDNNSPASPSRLRQLRDLLDPHRNLLLEGDLTVALKHDEKKLGYYLKLHGSLDWLHCPSLDCPNFNQFSVLRDHLRNQLAEGAPCRLCGSPTEVFLVPPTNAKSFGRPQKLRLLWSLAHRELSDATHLVIIGLSFAPSDVSLRWLVRDAAALRARQPKVLVVNPDPQGQRTAAHLFGFESVESARSSGNFAFLENFDEPAIQQIAAFKNRRD